MTRDDLLARLRGEAALFREQGVRHVSLFGSQARGDARPDSDIDLLVEYEPEKKASLLDLCRLERVLPRYDHRQHRPGGELSSLDERGLRG